MKKREEPMRTPRFLHKVFEGTVLEATGGAFLNILNSLLLVEKYNK